MSRSTAASSPRLLTVAEAAEDLGTATSRLYALVARHAIPSVRIGRAIRILQDALDQLDRSGDQRRCSPSPHRSASGTVPMPQRSHSAQRPGDRRQPNSRETGNSVTCMHPRATHRRVDAERPREARP